MTLPSVLLVTLGQSPMVVIEAALRPSARYREIHVFTSDHPEIETGTIEDWATVHLDDASLHIARLEGFEDLRHQNDHDVLNEALLRWYLAQLEEHGPEDLGVCIAGGYKSMSSALHRAAHLFGAGEIFHLQADSFPATPTEVELTVREGKIRYIQLGGEPGWPALRQLGSRSYPLEIVRRQGCVRWIQSSGDTSIEKHIRQRLSDTAVTARAWDLRDRFPFASLALLPPYAADWLEQPLDSEGDESWILALPKIELHCHLGGFATHGDALERVRAAGEEPPSGWPSPPQLPPGWPLPARPLPLDAYMALGDANGSSLLKDPACLRMQVDALYRSLLAEKIRYAEIRCSPANYATAERDAWTVLQEIRSHFRSARAAALAEGQTDAPFVNLLIIVTRRRDGDLSSLSRHLALAVTAASHESGHPFGARICGVDLAGFESPQTRAALFQHDFDPVHRCGLAVTVHAGEIDDVEGIWQAVFRLNARRIGHGLRLGDSPDLLRSVVERRVGVEMCPYANFQIHGFAPMQDQPPYPLPFFLDAGVPVSVNTDNPGISAAGLGLNYRLLPILCPGFTRRQLLQTLRNALDTAFLTQDERRRLTSSFDRSISASVLSHLA